MKMSLVLRLPREMHLSRSSSNVPRLPTLLSLLQNLHVLLTFDTVHNPLRLPRERISERPKVVQTCGVFLTCWPRNVLRAATACTFSTSELPKVLRIRQCFTLLTSKCASRHKGMHFFYTSTSNSLRLVCFGVLWTFWLPNVLRATTACNLLSLIWPHGSAPAALASLLFDPPEPQIIGKTQCFATFYLFAHLHLFSSDSFSSLIFSLLLFSSLTLLTSAFPSGHIVGSLTSKVFSIFKD